MSNVSTLLKTSAMSTDIWDVEYYILANLLHTNVWHSFNTVLCFVYVELNSFKSFILLLFSEWQVGNKKYLNFSLSSFQTLYFLFTKAVSLINLRSGSSHKVGKPQICWWIRIFSGNSFKYSPPLTLAFTERLLIAMSNRHIPTTDCTAL